LLFVAALTWGIVSKLKFYEFLILLEWHFVTFWLKVHDKQPNLFDERFVTCLVQL